MSKIAYVTSGQQSRALSLSTVAFALCFAIWTFLSIIGLLIRQDFRLSETERLCCISPLATPLSDGSLG